LSTGLATGGASARTPLRRARRRTTGMPDGLRGLLLVSPALLFILAVFVLPLVFAVWISLSDWPLLGAHHFTGLANYHRLLHDPLVGHAFLFTAEFAVVITPVLFLVGLGLATLLQHPRRGVGLFRTAIFAPVAIGFASASYLWLALTDPSTGLFDRLLVDVHLTTQAVNWLDRPLLAKLLVVIVTVWKLAGFSMITLMNGLQSIPTEIEEAARVDGTGRLRLLWSIKLPMMRDSIGFTLTFVSIGAFLTFDQFYILTEGGPTNSTITAVYRIYNTAFIQGQLGYASAVSVGFLVLLLLITGAQLFLLRRRYDQ